MKWSDTGVQVVKAEVGLTVAVLEEDKAAQIEAGVVQVEAKAVQVEAEGLRLHR